MPRRLSIRASAVSVMLFVVASSLGGAGWVAAASETPDRSTVQASTDTGASLGSSIKPLRDGVTNRPIAHGNMALASDRATSGAVPRLAHPYAGGSSSVPGSGPVRLAADAVPGAATITANPPIGHPGFGGLRQSSGPDTNGEPPDPYLAVGPEHVMQVTNSSFRTMNCQGAPVQSASLAGFIDTFGFAELAAASWFDPRIVYDSLHGRWLLTVDGVDCEPDGVNSHYGNGYLFLQRRTRPTPPVGGLGSYFFGPDLLFDYTAPGTSTDKFAFGSNLFDMFASGSCSAPNVMPAARSLFIDWADWLGADDTL